jgi:hypothetical protein
MADVTNQEDAQNPLRIDQCVCPIRAVELPVLGCLYNSCSEVTEVGGTLNFCDIQSHEFRAKLWGRYECNPAVPCRGMLNVCI